MVCLSSEQCWMVIGAGCCGNCGAGCCEAVLGAVGNCGAVLGAVRTY